MTATAQPRPPQALRRAIASEAVKTRTTRTPLLLLSIALLLPILGTAVAALSVGSADGADASTELGVRTILSSGFTAGLLATLAGVIAVTGEFRYRTISASLATVPSRGRWLLSKLAIAVPIGLGFTVLGQAAVLGVGLPILASKGVHVDPWQGDLLRMTLGTASLGVFAAAFGVGLGALIRNQVAAVTGIIVYTTMAEAAFLHFVPTVGQYLPGGAQAAIVADPTLEHLPMWAGFLVMTGWAAVFLVAGYVRLHRQDIPSS